MISVPKSNVRHTPREEIPGVFSTPKPFGTPGAKEWNDQIWEAQEALDPHERETFVREEADGD